MNAKTIATIQAAGAALHQAQAALTEDGRRCAERVREALGHDAFSVSNDGLFEHWKSVSRLAQSLSAMEAQLKDLYFMAIELAATGHASQPRSAPRLAMASAPAAPRGRGTGEVVDVVFAAPRTMKRRGAGIATPAAAEPTPTPAPRLRGNAVGTLAFLQARLDRDRFTRLTHAELADGGPMPRGSVGATIASLKTKGLLVEGERGSYRLA
jgi:hypothetical protein